MTRETGFNRNYQVNPYNGGESGEDASLLPGGGTHLPFPMPEPLDRRRPIRERVLGVPNGGGGGLAYPFGLLEERGRQLVVTDTVGGDPIFVFWSQDHHTARAFHAGPKDTFEVAGGRFLDVETRSTWTIEGHAVSGPRAGDRLKPVARAYVAYWFAWAAFQPKTGIWAPPSSGSSDQ